MKTTVAVDRVWLSMILGIASDMAVVTDLVGENWVPNDQGRADARASCERWRIVLGLAPKGLRACRVCGCIEERACEGGCSWAEQPTKDALGLCSKCAPAEKKTRRRK